VASGALLESMNIGLPRLRLGAPSLVSASLGRGDGRPAIALLLAALGLGAITRGLFWHTGIGLNFCAWDLLLVGANVAVFRRGAIRPAAWSAITACALLGFSVVRYASDWSLAIALPATLAILAALPILLRDGPDLGALAGLPWRMIASLRHTPAALGDTARLPGKAVGEAGRARLQGVMVGLLLGVPTAGLFTLLLSIDADFASALARAREALGDVVLFAVWTLLTSTGYLFAHALHVDARAVPGPVPPAAGPYREGGEAPPASPGAARVSLVTWGMVVGQVALVFAVFVGANVRHLFGGHAFVRAPGDVTYASYLHAGFGQLLFATVLSVCLVLTGHALLVPRGQPAGKVPGGPLLASLEGSLLVLTGVTVASCWQRLRIYEDAYGASHLRLGVAVIELTVLGVLVLTMGKVARRGWSAYGGAVLALVAGAAVLASAIDADAYVATKNLDRAARGAPLDVAYLASLSRDARGALAHPVVRADPALAARLEASFCGPRGDWRAFRGLGSCAKN
jgi:hypothetical protein